LIYHPKEQPDLIPNETYRHQYHPPIPEDSRPKERKIWGLRTTTFWLSLALGIVVTAAIVGGGVGGSIAVSNAKTPIAQVQSATSASSTTSTSLATTAWGPVATGQAFTGCPAANSSIYTSKFNPTRFELVCGLEIPYNSTSDILYALTSTLELCVELCATWNEMATTNGKAAVPCAGVSFRPSQLNGDVNGSPIDCALKSYATGLSEDSGTDSAILRGS